MKIYRIKALCADVGMFDYCDFVEQENRTTEDGRLRPDLIVRLPGGKSIVVGRQGAGDCLPRGGGVATGELRRG